MTPSIHLKAIEGSSVLVPFETFIARLCSAAITVSFALAAKAFVVASSATRPAAAAARSPAHAQTRAARRRETQSCLVRFSTTQPLRHAGEAYYYYLSGASPARWPPFRQRRHDHIVKAPRGNHTVHAGTQGVELGEPPVEWPRRSLHALRARLRLLDASVQNNVGAAATPASALRCSGVFALSSAQNVRRRHQVIRSDHVHGA